MNGGSSRNPVVNKVNVSVCALTSGQVTAQFILYRKNCSPKRRTALVPEVEPLLYEEVELSALEDTEKMPTWTT